MAAMNNILSRRSIRKYTSQSVAEQVLKALLEAAMSAPSAGNNQPWHFVVITRRQILDEFPRIHPYSQLIEGAPLAVVVCGDLRVQTREGVLAQECAAATENLLLAVHANGLGAVWLAIYPVEDRVFGVQELLKLPEYILPVALIPIGHPAEKKARAHRYDDSKVHYNQW
jgi:nitroreductase